jgi:hypothetical protein
MSTGLGKVQIEAVAALAAIETAKPGHSVNIPELAALIFDTDKVSEAMRITTTRALGSLEDEKLVTKVVTGKRSRDVTWRIHPNIVRTLIRPVGTSKDAYLKRVSRWLGPAQKEMRL